ncbi:nucleoside-diphosphate sugar epimerase [Paenibacillus sinopodophylli]|uniref:nucleoside-diphosphate sugar epimerase n=1 Tax=Paenibacillus sinopodophylli TaxID=1837342 RepID=UPI00110CC8BC|nr:nucleoside-diphosphate sugar epimerase [Paenibacillus sinopodophylli]
MHQSITEVMHHMSQASTELARLLEAERHITVRLSEIVKAIPDEDPEFGGINGILDNTQSVGQSIIAYLNSLAEFQETLAGQLTFVIHELREPSEEE